MKITSYLSHLSYLTYELKLRAQKVYNESIRLDVPLFYDEGKLVEYMDVLSSEVVNIRALDQQLLMVLDIAQGIIAKTENDPFWPAEEPKKTEGDTK
jgi:hypothetical protein